MKAWYLLYCKRNEQNRAFQHLTNQNLECFYPTIKVEKVVRSKLQNIEEPVFPSYMFVNFDYLQGPSFTSIRSTRGVVDFVRVGAQPKEVPSSLIDEMRSLDMSNVGRSSLPSKGDRIYVKSGKFADVEAIFQEWDGEKRSIMLVKMLSQYIPVSIDNHDLAFN